MMIYLYPDELEEKFKKKFHENCYILFGDDLFLLEDTKNLILKYIKSFTFYEYHNFLLNNKSSFEEIMAKYQTKNLFGYKKKFFYLLPYLKKKSIYDYCKTYTLLLLSPIYIHYSFFRKTS